MKSCRWKELFIVYLLFNLIVNARENGEMELIQCCIKCIALPTCTRFPYSTVNKTCQGEVLKPSLLTDYKTFYVEQYRQRVHHKEAHCNTHKIQITVRQRDNTITTQTTTEKKEAAVKEQKKLTSVNSRSKKPKRKRFCLLKRGKPNGFLAKTTRNLYYFDLAAKGHKFKLRGLSSQTHEFVHFVFQEGKLYALTEGQLKVAIYRKYKLHFKIDVNVTVLCNERVRRMALDRKNNVLATVNGKNNGDEKIQYSKAKSIKELQIVDLVNTKPTVLTTKKTFLDFVYIDRCDGLIFYQSTAEYLVAVNYRGVDITEYKEIKLPEVKNFKIENHKITCYTCRQLEENPTRYDYYMKSKKTKHRKITLDMKCIEFDHFIKFRRNHVYAGPGSVKGLMVYESDDIHTRITDEKVLRVFWPL